jgi:DtxR family Mn-dependent transcriptional regulator
MALLATTALSDIPEGERVRVARIPDDSNSELLRYLAGIGLVPGAEVRVVALAPFLGPLTIEVGEQIQVIGRNLADLILVQQIGLDAEISA